MHLLTARVLCLWLVIAVVWFMQSATGLAAEIADIAATPHAIAPFPGRRSSYSSRGPQ
jgi:hypothetical protein